MTKAPMTQTGAVHFRAVGFGFFQLEHLELFRVSDFEFWISGSRRHAGAALGLFEDTRYLTCQCELAAGDLVLLFTDGLFEVMNAAGQEDYGQERLLAAARDRLTLPLPELFDALIAGVRKFSGGAEFSDDVCLLGMEVTRVDQLRPEANGTGARC